MDKKLPNLRINDIVEVKITSLGSSGEGVGRTEGFAIFVPNALPGETVTVKLKNVKKTYAAGTLVKVLEPAPERVKPVCAVYYQCGGCQLQQLSYAGQLAVKQQQVIDALERIGHFKGIKVEKTLGAVNPLNYRNKMQVPVAGDKGNLEIGCFALGTHRVINVEACYIQKEKNNEIAAVVRAWMKQYKIPAYNEDKRTGMIRHVMGRVGVETGEIMVVIVAAVKAIPHMKELVTMLKAQIPGVTSVLLNINTRHTNVIMGEQTRLVYGKPIINDKIGSLKFSISAQSFFQVNSEQARVLYDTALSFAALTGEESVVDVYCGTGTITLFLAQKAKIACGIEIVPSAIEDARKNAMANGITNAKFILGDAAQKLPELMGKGSHPDVIVLDPPRAGCDERVLRSILSVKPKRIVYVSCNPATLARDLALLCTKDYKINRVQPVDMFPQTHHVETVTLMSRQS